MFMMFDGRHKKTPGESEASQMCSSMEQHISGEKDGIPMFIQPIFDHLLILIDITNIQLSFSEKKCGPLL